MATRNTRLNPWNVEDDTVPLGARYALRRLGHGTQHWKRRDALVNVDTNATVATVLSCPHNARAGAPGSVMLKVANDQFYNYGWHGVLTDMMDGLGWQYEATTQLDLSADGYGFLEPFRYAKREAIVPGGRSEWNVRNLPGVRGLKATELGTRGGNKFARIYRKSKEIQLSGKHYITDYWRDMQCPDVDNVERCEVSVKGKELRRYVKRERDRSFLDMLTSPKQRAVLYHSLVEQFMWFHGGEERSRDRTNLLAWDWSLIAEDEQVNALPRDPRMIDLGYNASKAAIRYNFTCYVATGRHHFLESAETIADGCGLMPWMEARAALWYKQAPKLVANDGHAAKLFNALQGTTRGELESDIGALRIERAALEVDAQKWRQRKLNAVGIASGLFDAEADQLDAAANVLRIEIAERKAREAEERANRKEKRKFHREKMYRIGHGG